MAHLRILLFLLLHKTCVLLQLSAPSPQHALNGSDILLPCIFTVGKPSIELKFLAVFWYFNDKEILRYDNKGLSKYSTGVSFNKEAAKDGNVSLTLSDVTISDGGTYRCVVIYSPEKDERDIKLEILVPPIITIPNKVIIRNKDHMLHCSAIGFYPADINITWLGDGEILQRSLLGKVHQNFNGTYNVDSTVTITKNHEKRMLSCRVQHASLKEPLQEDFYPVYIDEQPIVVIVVSCAAAVVLVGAVTGVILRFKCRQTKALQSITVSDIKGPLKMIEGEEVTLYCTATNCTGDMHVKWFEEINGSESEIPHTQSQDEEESENLLGRLYVVTLNREGHNDQTSSIRFIPSVEKHRNVTFSCRFNYAGKTREKRFLCNTLCAKPQILEPVKHILCASGEILYSLKLQKFYPKDICISWTCGVGDLHNTILSKEISEENPAGRFNVCSEIRIPGDHFKDPSFSLYVTWEHKSLDTAGSKYLTIKDQEFTWTPKVEEIQTPLMLHETPVTLQCNISLYFPNALTVRWLRREEGSQELTEVTDRPDIKSHRDQDNTYSCTTSLTVTPTLSTDQGAEYICRVLHPTLVQPIERSTGKLIVMAKPQAMEPIKIESGASSRVKFSLNLQRFHPNEIEIKWKHGDCLQHFKESEKKIINTDETFSALSECNFPGHLFNDPTYKIAVIWNHVTIDNPESRELSVRDFPWKPQLQDIIVPRLEANKKATIKCNISNYFPDNLTADWLIKETGSDVESALPDGYHVSVREKHTQEDGTLTCQTCVTFTPNTKKAQIVEFICRVNHPTLEKPKERRTRPLIIGGSNLTEDEFKVNVAKSQNQI
ncbi:uncharacterized protein LOC128641644 [Bombina bombina]|uniref:uncharacterized protein LOC128641644 n=1 Tax=Bombina bombina TaxID=8345 RepID=UPI00235A6879|nr:uncharacterized protein LOC128641644 [Bombina bombina]